MSVRVKAKVDPRKVELYAKGKCMGFCRYRSTVSSSFKNRAGFNNDTDILLKLFHNSENFVRRGQSDMAHHYHRPFRL